MRNASKLQPEDGNLSGVLREVFRQPSTKEVTNPPKPDSPVAKAVRDVLREAVAAKPARGAAATRAVQGRARKSVAGKPTSSTLDRLKLAQSLAQVRTNILAASDMTPMQKLLTARVANELASRLRKLP